MPTPYKINCWFQLIYVSPRGLSIYDLFATISTKKHATFLIQIPNVLPKNAPSKIKG